VNSKQTKTRRLTAIVAGNGTQRSQSIRGECHYAGSDIVFLRCETY